MALGMRDPKASCELWWKPTWHLEWETQRHHGCCGGNQHGTWDERPKGIMGAVVETNMALGMREPKASWELWWKSTWRLGWATQRHHGCCGPSVVQRWIFFQIPQCLQHEPVVLGIAHCPAVSEVAQCASEWPPGGTWTPVPWTIPALDKRPHKYLAAASQVAQWVKNPPAMQESWVSFLGWEDSLVKEMATHSSVLAWRIPWTEEPGGLQSMGSQESDTTATKPPPQN